MNANAVLDYICRFGMKTFVVLTYIRFASIVENNSKSRNFPQTQNEHVNQHRDEKQKIKMEKIQLLIRLFLLFPFKKV